MGRNGTSSARTAVLPASRRISRSRYGFMDTKIDFSGTFLLPLSENAVADSGNRSKVALRVPFFYK
jgi:hypothetical protein